eukprot:m.12771 g.12771  ORF g.12771 m.12771 type:complete len:255 (+) comp9947_c0_seq2:1541-2305(+)
MVGMPVGVSVGVSLGTCVGAAEGLFVGTVAKIGGPKHGSNPGGQPVSLVLISGRQKSNALMHCPLLPKRHSVQSVSTRVVVGALEGEMLGVSVGVSVGSKEGGIVGASVGESVVGETVGVSVGVSVGTSDGSAEMNSVGTRVGDAVDRNGVAVGLADGASEGTSVGVLFGIPGAAVGDNVVGDGVHAKNPGGHSVDNSVATGSVQNPKLFLQNPFPPPGQAAHCTNDAALVGVPALKRYGCGNKTKTSWLVGSD